MKKSSLNILILLTVLFVIVACKSSSRSRRRRPNRRIPCVNDKNETFKLGDFHWINDCQQCVCTKYGFLCPSFDCEGSECVDAEFVKGKCCPVCPNGPNCGVTDKKGKNMKIIPLGKKRRIGGKMCQCIKDESSYVWHKYKSQCE